MATDRPTSQSPSTETRPAFAWLAALASSPLLWGGMLTVGVYSLIPHLPVQRELAVRYFCSHPLEYATATLFFVGVAILGLKLVRLRREQAALAGELTKDLAAVKSPDPMQAAEQLEGKLDTVPARLRSTHLVGRVRDVLDFVRGRRSSAGLEDHLKYLAEVSAERLHDSYALVRTITWAVPILGFLGTVIGITLAIANVTPEQLDTSLDAVIDGLAVAFDTTALALGLSLLLVFAAFPVERAERDVLSRVEEFGAKRLAGLFPAGAEAQGPLAAAEMKAAEQLLQRTESLVTWQTDLWRGALESMRARWTESLEKQQEHLDETLKQGMLATLDDHAGQLAALRTEFLLACQQFSHELGESLNESRHLQRQQQEQFGRQLNDLWSSIQSDVSERQTRQTKQAEQMISSLAERVSGWQKQLRAGSEAMTAQLEELRRQGEVLLQVVEQEENLARLEARLAENLEALRSTEAFEETLHSLSAAVHLLTIRTKPNAA